MVELMLAEGGQGSVYRLRHSVLGGLVALKVLKHQNPATLKRLLLEGRIQARLRHPNIVQVIDVLDIEGAAGLVMEYVEGPDLHAWLTRAPPPMAQVEVVFLQILDALDVAHAAGIVHRDLKPANVLLENGRAGLVAKVTDFGLARAGGDDDTRLTSTGVAMGTVAYMAPEQVVDSKNVDCRADVFALGCILYELLTGRKAFGARDVVSHHDLVKRGHYVSPDQFRSEIEARYVDAVTGALAFSPARRIPDCATLRAVLLGQTRWVAPAVPTQGSDRAEHVPQQLPPTGLAEETFDPNAMSESPWNDEPVASIQDSTGSFEFRPGQAASFSADSAAASPTPPTAPPAPLTAGPAPPTVQPAPPTVQPGPTAASEPPPDGVPADRAPAGTRRLPWYAGGFVVITAIALIVWVQRTLDSPTEPAPQDDAAHETVAEPEPPVVLSNDEPAPDASPAAKSSPSPPSLSEAKQGAATAASPRRVETTPPKPDRRVDEAGRRGGSTTKAATAGGPAPVATPSAAAPETIARRPGEQDPGGAAASPNPAGDSPVVVGPIGTLYVRGMPHQGTVYIDGISQGRSVWRGDIVAGPHVVELRADSGKIAKSDVDVRANRDTYLCLSFTGGGRCPG
jgi:eukaryotic-like serine/threonine-protein kinase